MRKDYRVKPVRKGLNLLQHRSNSSEKWRTYAAIGSYTAACAEMGVLIELNLYLPEH